VTHLAQTIQPRSRVAHLTVVQQRRETTLMRQHTRSTAFAIGTGIVIVLIAACDPAPPPPSAAATVAATPTTSNSAVLASGGGAASANISTYRGDAARTGVMPGPGPAAKPDLLWQFQAGAGIESSPAVVAGTVFVTSSDGIVDAVDLRTGALRWKVDAGAAFGSASPLVVDGQVIVGDRGGTVHALDAATGKNAWTVSTDGPIAGAAAAIGDTVFIATEAGTAYAMAASTGAVRWQAKLAAGLMHSIAASGDLVYCTLAHGHVEARRAADGSLAWSARFPDDGAGGTPAIADGLVFVPIGLDSLSTTTRAVVALDAATGTERWRRSSKAGAVLYAPAVADGTGYIVGEDKTVAAVDAETGAERWTTSTGAINDALPAIWDRTVYVATQGNNLQALDTATGTVDWRVPIVGVPYSPVVTDGLVLVGTNVGVLFAFGEPVQ
jgi:outer membrane protein assembly factor BamB